MNILDKFDKSMAPVPTGPGISKFEKFKWAKPCSPGNFQFIMKTDLNIDGNYQRGENHLLVVRIAKDFDWSLFGTLSVAERDDHTLWVFDGGHRLRAAFYHQEINYVPCMVYKLKDVAAEAMSFVGFNTSSRRVSPCSIHKAALAANEDVALGVQNIISSNGYHINGNQDAGSFKAVNTLRNLYHKNPAAAGKVFRACAYIADGGYIHAKFFNAMIALVSRFKDEILNDRYLDILKNAGMAVVFRAIDQQTVVEGAASHNSGARGIMNLINSKQRGKRKLVWSPVERDEE